jgi:polysaccharide pyruvyl transferase WcaK-like protein
MTRTLTFVGWYGRRNAGDEAFREVHEALFPGVPKRWISTAGEAGDPAEQVYVLGGGDVFLDYYIDMIPAGAKFFAYGIGLGGPEQVQGVLARRDRLHGIWLRNPADVATLRDAGLDAHLTPDIALLLGDAVKARPRHPFIAASKRKRLVFCPSGNADQTALQRSDLGDFFYQGYLKVALARQLDELSKFYDIVMLPLSFDYKDMDLGYIGQVHGLMKRAEAAKVVAEELPPLDVARLVADCELCVSMKFHGLVFAALSGVPFVNIGLTRKTQMFCGDLGLPELSIQPYTLNDANMLTAVKRAEAPETLARLKAKVASLVEEARAAADSFRKAVLAELA